MKVLSSEVANPGLSWSCSTSWDVSGRMISCPSGLGEIPPVRLYMFSASEPSTLLWRVIELGDKELDTTGSLNVRINVLVFMLSVKAVNIAAELSCS